MNTARSIIASILYSFSVCASFIDSTPEWVKTVSWIVAAFVTAVVVLVSLNEDEKKEDTIKNLENRIKELEKSIK